MAWWNKKFLASHNRMESKSEHMKLPCNVPELGCQMGRCTYVLEDSNCECPIHRI
ncbi:MAG: hypothetical protein GY696_19775 [Gammaproteobacteria bacterium]|nr:hypothetical protein [Gammaproteobacteria bacterium]